MCTLKNQPLTEMKLLYFTTLTSPNLANEMAQSLSNVSSCFLQSN
ncbi:hypothetical protein IFVP18_C150604 [Vibrio parahaemolyticus]